ncbi:hypothetical protein EI555_008835, partial [Monodon monoceros]
FAVHPERLALADSGDGGNMSVAFAAPRQRGKGEITPAAIQKPPTQNMPMGPGGMNQSGPPPPPRSHNMPSDGMVAGGPPAPHMQNQMNGQMPGPNHMPMQGPGPNQLNMTNSSMNMPSSSHGSMGGYSHSVPSSQSMPVQNQMTMSQGQPMGNYGPRPNMNIQPNQGPMMHQQPPSQQYNMPQGGPPQQYSGQEDYYGDQYSHGGQGPPEGMNQQYYPDGNSQYGQQQDAYQGPPPQQGYPAQQQQYPGQQGYPGQQQGYAFMKIISNPDIAAAAELGLVKAMTNHDDGAEYIFLEVCINFYMKQDISELFMADNREPQLIMTKL